MAEEKKQSWLSKLTPKAWLADNDKAEQITEGVSGYGYDGVTVSMLLGSGKRAARARQAIYDKYHYMAGDPIISTALRLHVTAALGGHETTGDVVFIESAQGTKDGQSKKIVEELARDLGPIFNRVAHQVAFNGAAFGDAYARVYTKDKIGIVDLYTDEMVYPPLVQSYEQGNKTIGYMVASGQKFTERLTIKQMARMKMPRMLYVPQMRVMEKSQKVLLAEDDLDKAPLLPSLIGGSFLDAAEESYDNLMSALTGLVGQRILESIQESMISLNLTASTEEQRKKTIETFKNMLIASKKRAEKAVTENKPILERIYHLIPTYADKQVTSIQDFKGASSQNITVEDVMFHAKMLAGALGIDLAMLGFSELLSGGLGDGGFFRMSAQAAERSRQIRGAMTRFYDDLIDLHTLSKYGFVFGEGERPYHINFYGSISALENEKATTGERKMNGGAMLVQNLVQMKDLGLDDKANEFILSKVMGLDEPDAKTIAKSLKEAAEKAKEEGGGGFGGEPGIPGVPGLGAPGMGDPTIDGDNTNG